MNWILNQDHLTKCITSYCDAEELEALQLTCKRFSKWVIKLIMEINKNSNILVHNGIASILQPSTIREIRYFHCKARTFNQQCVVDLRNLNFNIATALIIPPEQVTVVPLQEYMSRAGISYNNKLTLMDNGILFYECKAWNRLELRDGNNLQESFVIEKKFLKKRIKAFMVVEDTDLPILEYLFPLSDKFANKVGSLLDILEFYKEGSTSKLIEAADAAIKKDLIKLGVMSTKCSLITFGRSTPTQHNCKSISPS